MRSLDTIALGQVLRIESISGMDYFCTFAPKMVYIKRLPTPSRYWWCAKKKKKKIGGVLSKMLGNRYL